MYVEDKNEFGLLKVIPHNKSHNRRQNCYLKTISKLNNGSETHEMLECTLRANRKLYRKIGMLPYSISPLSLIPPSPKHTIITVLLEKLTARQLVKKSSSFYAARKCITVFTTARHFSLAEARLILSTPTILCP
jgi:hypothetical protein